MSLIQKCLAKTIIMLPEIIIKEEFYYYNIAIITIITSRKGEPLPNYIRGY
jgi:hypothetical protein